jgi:hypothetical protein
LAHPRTLAVTVVLVAVVLLLQAQELVVQEIHQAPHLVRETMVEPQALVHQTSAAVVVVVPQRLALMELELLGVMVELEQRHLLQEHP